MSNLLFSKSPSNPMLQKVSSVVIICRDEDCDEASIDAALGTKGLPHTVKPKTQVKSEASS